MDGDYLLKMGDGMMLDISFLYIDRGSSGLYFCRSFFPMDRTDYTKNQMQYTLLKKEKIHLKTGEAVVSYDRLTPKNTKRGNPGGRINALPDFLVKIVSELPQGNLQQALVFLPAAFAFRALRKSSSL